MFTGRHEICAVTSVVLGATYSTDGIGLDSDDEEEHPPDENTERVTTKRRKHLDPLDMNRQREKRQLVEGYFHKLLNSDRFRIVGAKLLKMGYKDADSLRKKTIENAVFSMDEIKEIVTIVLFVFEDCGANFEELPCVFLAVAYMMAGSGLQRDGVQLIPAVKKMNMCVPDAHALKADFDFQSKQLTMGNCIVKSKIQKLRAFSNTQKT